MTHRHSALNLKAIKPYVADHALQSLATFITQSLPLLVVASAQAGLFLLIYSLANATAFFVEVSVVQPLISNPQSLNEQGIVVHKKIEPHTLLSIFFLSLLISSVISLIPLFNKASLVIYLTGFAFCLLYSMQESLRRCLYMQRIPDEAVKHSLFSLLLILLLSPSLLVYGPLGYCLALSLAYLFLSFRLILRLLSQCHKVDASKPRKYFSLLWNLSSFLENQTRLALACLQRNKSYSLFALLQTLQPLSIYLMVSIFNLDTSLAVLTTLRLLSNALSPLYQVFRSGFANTEIYAYTTNRLALQVTHLSFEAVCKKHISFRVASLAIVGIFAFAFTATYCSDYLLQSSGIASIPLLFANKKDFFIVILLSLALAGTNFIQQLLQSLLLTNDLAPYSPSISSSSFVLSILLAILISAAAAGGNLGPAIIVQAILYPVLWIFLFLFIFS